MLLRILSVVLILGLIGSIIYFAGGKEKVKRTESVKTQVSKGDFLITVTGTGELKAKRSEKIRGPQGMRSARIYQTTITDMVAEGTVVKKGDYVATLDKTELDQKVKEAQTEIEKIHTQLEQAKIDTAIELKGLRDQLINLKFSMKEKQLQVEQSRYEPQMVIRQAELDLDKTQRDYNQLQTKYELTQEKSQARISEINTQLRQQEFKLNQVKDLARGFVIRAPKKGMVIYRSNWNGKIGPGSQISTWDPVVAELPDLTDMVSKTYVNEVDISRVKKGQDVRIRVDAFPENTYTGQVIQVANIGETLRGYDAKVFEVVVQVNEADSILRPAMTTSNQIVTDIIPEVISIPIEALQVDSLSYVFQQEGGKLFRQEVITGLTNSDEVIVEHGLKESDVVLLTIPEEPETLPFRAIDQALKDEIRKKQEEEKKARQARMLEKMKSVKEEEITADEGESSSFIIFR
jgi:multidrug efflux pump subunit AcrA (membrane-fusion protein)